MNINTATETRQLEAEDAYFSDVMEVHKVRYLGVVHLGRQ